MGATVHDIHFQQAIDGSRLGPRSVAPALCAGAISATTCRRSVFVDVITVLVVPVAVVEVVLVVTVLHGLTSVTRTVGTLVIAVDHRFGVALVPVQMVDVALMFDRLAPVARQVFVVRYLGVCGTHAGSLRRRSDSTPSLLLGNPNSKSTACQVRALAA